MKQQGEEGQTDEMRFQGRIKFDYRLKASGVECDDDEYTYTMKFSKENYDMLMALLKSGAPVWIGMQRTPENPPVPPDEV